MSLWLPKADVGGEDAAAFVVTTDFDPAGRIRQVNSPSTGTERFIYDRAGNLRFRQPDANTDAAGFVYVKYDRLRRPIEIGTMAQRWSTADLQQSADQPHWPDATVPRTVWQRIGHDGDGRDPNAIGRTVEVVTTTTVPDNTALGNVTLDGDATDGEIQIVERHDHDQTGRVVTRSFAITGDVTITAAIGYAYNALGEVTRLTYPDASPVASVTYRRDDRGAVVAIGEGTGPSGDWAQYGCTADGQITFIRYPGASLIEPRTVTAQGRLRAKRLLSPGDTNPVFEMEDRLDADGAVMARTIRVGGGRPGDAAMAPFTTQMIFTYDDLRRLVAANMTNGRSGCDSNLVYDGHGNLVPATLDERQTACTFMPGSDRLTSVAVGACVVSVQYGSDGWPIRYGNDDLVCSPALRRVVRISRAGGTAMAVR